MHEIERWFDGFFEDFNMFQKHRAQGGTLTRYKIAADKDGSRELRVELPGVPKEDVKVFIDGADVKISWREKTMVVTLASRPDLERSAAQMKDGMLVVSLPEHSGPAGREILVR